MTYYIYVLMATNWGVKHFFVRGMFNKTNVTYFLVLYSGMCTYITTCFVSAGLYLQRMDIGANEVCKTGGKKCV
jgi:hypothetical protein